MTAIARPLRMALLVAVLSVAGCASIPDDGGVHRAPQGSDELSDPMIYQPPGPIPGSSPDELVWDFVDAMRAYPVSSEFARDFLTDAAEERWNPTKQTIVYSDVPDSDRVGSGRIRLTMDMYATLGPRGTFTAQHGRQRTYEVEMRKVDGQWRIKDLPNAYLISQSMFENSYRSLSLYFISKSGRYAVPEPVYQPDGEQLPTNVMTSLLRGPSETTSRIASTYLPKGTELDVSVTVDNDVAEVRLAGELDKLPTEQRERMGAQIALTLGQVPGVSSVEILANELPYEIPGADPVQDVDGWNRYDPSLGRPDTSLFALRGGDPVLVRGNQVHQVVGPWSKFPKIGDFGIEPDLERIAAVDRDRKTVRVGSMAVDAANPRILLTGQRFLSPRWDPYGWLWLTDTDAKSTRVSVWQDGRPHQIPIGPLSGMPTQSLSISPDGTRFAAVAAKPGKNAANQLYVGEIRRSGKADTPVEFLAVRQVGLSDIHSLSSVEWRDTANLVLLAERGTGSPQPFIVAIDGSNVVGGESAEQPLLPDVAATAIVASGRVRDPIYVTASDGDLWRLDNDQRWSEVGDRALWQPHFVG